jgi:entericidin B
MPTKRFAALAALLLLGLAACNTMEGLGQDVKSGGQALERSAQDVKQKM